VQTGIKNFKMFLLYAEEGRLSIFVTLFFFLVGEGKLSLPLCWNHKGFFNILLIITIFSILDGEVVT